MEFSLQIVMVACCKLTQEQELDSGTSYSPLLFCSCQYILSTGLAHKILTKLYLVILVNQLQKLLLVGKTSPLASSPEKSF